MSGKKLVNAVAVRGCYDEKKQFRNPGQEGEAAADRRFFTCSTEYFKQLEAAGAAISLERHKVLQGGEPTKAAAPATGDDAGGDLAAVTQERDELIAGLNELRTRVTELEGQLTAASTTYDEQVEELDTLNGILAERDLELEGVRGELAMASDSLTQQLVFTSDAQTAMVDLIGKLKAAGDDDVKLKKVVAVAIK